MRNPFAFAALWLFALVTSGAEEIASPQPPTVVTEYGLVRGTAESSLTVYRGIPFAAAPVGDLRWRPPQPAEKWEGVRPTTKFAPDPIQGAGTGPEMSEDCQYLNVWTPAKAADEHLPVLVWIDGGGFNGGGTRWDTGENLAKKGVVFVSIAYRVGQIGFLAHPELSAESDRHVSGNVLAPHPKTLVFLGGINDLFAEGTPQSVGTNLRSILELARKAGNVPIFVCEVLPCKGRPREMVTATNAALAKVVGDFANVHLVKAYAAFLKPDGTQDENLFLDGTHPNEAGYVVFQKTLLPELAKCVPRD